MPAVDPARLRFQITNLIETFNSPPVFHRQLSDLFSFYANRTLRFGNSAQPEPNIPAYKLPHPVIRQLELDLKPLINSAPQSALNLADELWNDSYFEVKQIAVFILGTVPVETPQPIRHRIDEWLTPKLDRALSSYLLSTGTLHLQLVFPEAWETFVQSLLNQGSPKMIGLGLKALAEGVNNPTFTNLPAIFRLVSPFIREPQPEFMKDLAHLIESLIKNSPMETAYFLKQTLSVSDSPLTKRLVKQNLSLLPENIRHDLRLRLRK